MTFKDQNDKTSSKRVMAFISLIFAMGISVIALTVAENPDVAVNLVKSFLMFSGGLAGVSVAEFFKKG